MIRGKLIYIASLLAFIHAPARAAEVVFSADQAGMGGTSVAASESNAAMTANPSLIALHERYDLHVHGRLGYDGRGEWAVSAVDARTSKHVSLGVIYHGDVSHPELRTSELPGWTEPGETPSNVKRHHDIVAALAFPIVGRRFALGLSGTWSFYNHDRQGTGGSGNVDFGLGWHATDWLVVGASGRNLIPIDGIGELPLTAALGGRATWSSGAFGLDLTWRDVTADLPLTAATGFELPVGEVPVFRVGYRYEGQRETHRVTGGFGLKGQTGEVSLGVMVPVSPAPTGIGDIAWILAIHLKAPSTEPPEF